MTATSDTTTGSSRHTASERAATKRRAVRKGTRSCWECRRRKIRCLFDENGPHDTCWRCWQKGTPCVSQEFPEDRLPRTQAPVGNVGDRLGRMERLVEQLYRKKVQAINGESQQTSQPPPHQSQHTSTLHQPSLNGPLATLSKDLTAALPSKEDCEIIHEPYSDADLVFQLLLTPHQVLESLQPEPVEHFVAGLYHPMHPVLLAKRMLTLATMLQRIPSTYKCTPSTSATPRKIMERLADAAISLVCENNNLMGTIDALQCVILQTVYLANGGNLRLSLLACRRAVSIAQLMGIHRPHDQLPVETVDPSGPPDIRFVWFRIVYIERFICLLLGLPDSTRDHHSGLASDGSILPPLDDHPLGRLEQVHCAVASRIIQRNQIDTHASMIETTHTLDLEMRMAAAAMPPRWWTLPKFTSLGSKPLTSVTESLRLCGQIFHYFLLVQLHLPFMLRSSPSGAASTSRIACVDASREILSRFVTIRSAIGVCSIPDAADFFALIAAMTLLLAHVDARRRDGGNDVLAHQRHTDRDKVEETLELMREGSSTSTDMLAMKSADVLVRLLDIEAHAARGSAFTANSTTDAMLTPSSESREAQGGDSSVLRLKIPCYGTVTISPDALLSREPFRPINQQVQQNQGRVDASITSAVSPAMLMEMDETTGAGLGPSMPLSSDQGLLLHPSTESNWLTDGPGHQLYGSGFSAGVEDWAFQGVDAAFFDSMIRGFEESDST
ncbi:Dehydrocurvularin biosynthesis regulator [Colletotrichum gloeosporioides]|uniref:Dehydrocurvularin biosynthesis regulator n=1 Tax=Colletotrichum gloeosporioides TaxID=474922 RepID=A0A8H4CT79_COLGL|nr:Dehydrocurvularin biosynthesis regulator [Colletotrichum gloeosporioides]KAF3809527.1 Dehydrocurvularin biosynthesis regulator [Colletotrichum gloeosporioides]